MLQLENITGGYTKNNPILKGINLAVEQNKVVAIVGQNGAGKSTLAKAIMNMLPFVSGNIYWNSELLNSKSTQEIVNKGLSFFMQGGRIFPHLTVEENLNFAGMGLSKKELLKRKEGVKTYFDLFKNGRLNLQASYLSGGEQHQLALAMVMMRKPKFLILDEPSAGLSPGNVKKLYETLNTLKRNLEISILLIEQNVRMAFEFSDTVFLLQQGMLEKTDVSLKQIEQKYFKHQNY